MLLLLLAKEMLLLFLRQTQVGINLKGTGG